MWSLATGQATQVGAHDAPVRHAAFVKELGLLVTGSWDRTLRYWDARSPTAAHTQALPERVYALDVKHPLMVVGLANRRIQVSGGERKRAPLLFFPASHRLSRTHTPTSHLLPLPPPPTH